MSSPVTDWPFAAAHGEPLIRADFRTRPEDFRVDEDLGFEPEGQGEHWLVQLRKRGDNTAWVAGQLARLAGIKPGDVGYCGLKDRHAETSQWFSLYLPKSEAPSRADIEALGLEVLASGWHPRKLRRGQHRGNRFSIRLRRLRVIDDTESLDERLETIEREGVPNYFGVQRFGRDGGNLERARRWFEQGETIRQRSQRGMAMSAARAWLFNEVLSARVEDESWRNALPGEPSSEPTGPLWGRGRPLSDMEAGELEAQCLEPWRDWLSGLEHVGLKQERRALVLMPEEMAWRREDGDLVIDFALSAGTFATAVLSEFAELETMTPGAS